MAVLETFEMGLRARDKIYLTLPYLKLGGSGVPGSAASQYGLGFLYPSLPRHIVLSTIWHGSGVRGIMRELKALKYIRPTQGVSNVTTLLIPRCSISKM